MDPDPPPEPSLSSSLSPLPVRLHYLDRTEPSLGTNLALDEALLLAAENDAAGAVLRVWESPRLAVVLGASCRLNRDVDVEVCLADGVPITRRASGGGTVVIGPGALNITVVLPTNAAPWLGAVDTAQGFVCHRLAAALSRAGTHVQVEGLGDLTLVGRKFAGSAQRRLKHHFLVHLSLLYDLPASTVTRYLRDPPRQPEYRARRTHEDFLTNYPGARDEIVDAVRSAWRFVDSGVEYRVSEGMVRELAETKYDDPAWVGRL